ncbi:hypothetical protein LCGC14_1131180 [marine sediment metagenome]|uniref:Uncharacterized protein n=1 Tax=marine sediment metagenome TaxID=412755 RepID=A0A0F9M5X5_9ZZZZ
MRIGDRDITMSKGWIAQFEDGTVICEDDMPWNKVPKKKNIQHMILKWEERFWSLTDKEHYTVPKKKGYMDVSTGGVSGGIHSRTIGYYDMEEKCKVILRVEEATGQMQYDIEPFE